MSEVRGATVPSSWYFSVKAERDQLREIAQRFVDAYPGGQAGALGNGAARRAHDEFRKALGPKARGDG